MSIAAQYGNWVAETSATTGTGDITLGGVLAATYTTVASVLADGETAFYHIFDRTTSDQESGVCTYTLAGNTIARDVRSTLVGGVYDDATPSPITLGGDAVVYLSVTAETVETFSSAIAGKVSIDGSTPMTGELLLSDDAVSTLGAVPKQQLDAESAMRPRRNLLDNAQFNIVQRDNTGAFSGLDKKFVVDRWNLSPNGGIGTCNRTTFGAGGTELPYKYGLNITTTTSSDYLELSHTIEGTESLINSAVTFSCYYLSDRDLTVRLYSKTDAGDRYEPNGVEQVKTLPNSNSVYTSAALTFIVPSRDAAWTAADGHNLVFEIGTFDDATTASWVFSMFRPKFEYGAYATVFVHTHYEEDFARCQRYCYANDPADVGYPGDASGWRAGTNGANAHGMFVQFPVQMRTTPTVTLLSENAEGCTYGDTLVTRDRILVRVTTTTAAYRYTADVFADAEIP